jgi:hypothetical protein
VLLIPDGFWASDIAGSRAHSTTPPTLSGVAGDSAFGAQRDAQQF